MRHRKIITETKTGAPLPETAELAVTHNKNLPRFAELTEEEQRRMYMWLRLIAIALNRGHTIPFRNDQLVITLTVGELKQLISECIAEAQSKTALIPTDEPLLKRKEVASMLRISLTTLHQWMRENRIPYHRIHSRIYFKASEVREALNSPTRPRY